MKGDIQKKTLVRLNPEESESSAWRSIVTMLELSKESDEKLWKELILTVMDDMEKLQSREGKRLRAEIMRRLQDDI